MNTVVKSCFFQVWKGQSFLPVLFLMVVSLKHTVHGPGLASWSASCPESTIITALAQSVLEGILKCYDLRFYGLRTY